VSRLIASIFSYLPDRLPIWAVSIEIRAAGLTMQRAIVFVLYAAGTALSGLVAGQSCERAEADATGWIIAHDGLEVRL
jgi:hypothetical protein